MMQMRLWITFCLFGFLYGMGAGAASAGALDEALIYHVYFGKIEEVQRLLTKGANPNAKDEHGWTALAIASDRSDAQATPIAKALIERGADINAAEDYNYPVVNAILNKNASLVEVLMARGVNIKVTDAKGNTLPVLARKMGQLDIIYYLDKRAFEEAQWQKYLFSAERLRQLTDKFVMANCQYQYWSFYLKSEQDEKMDTAALTRRITENGQAISALAAEGSRFFEAFRGTNANTLAKNVRENIFKQLNDMVSNRNRREHGVGKEPDMFARCAVILNAIRNNNHTQNQGR